MSYNCFCRGDVWYLNLVKSGGVYLIQKDDAAKHVRFNYVKYLFKNSMYNIYQLCT